MLVENRDFFIPHPQSTSQLIGSPPNIASTFRTEKKLEWLVYGLPEGEKTLIIYLLVLIQCINVSNGRTDMTDTAQRHRLHYA